MRVTQHIHRTICLLVFFAVNACHAQSLWQSRDQQVLFLFSDTNARSVGDLLTVVIRESTDVDNKDERALEQKRSNGFGFDTSGTASGIAGTGGSLSAKSDFKGNRDRSFDGSSKYSVARGFSDRITVTVLDIHPNGNLIIGGKRTRIVSGETRQLVVSGIVRPIDINPDNTVESPYIANFQVSYEGRGQETQTTDGSNWLYRKWCSLWGF